jgi:hypothetical protein
MQATYENARDNNGLVPQQQRVTSGLSHQRPDEKRIRTTLRSILCVSIFSAACLLASVGLHAQMAYPSAVYDPTSPNPVAVFFENSGVLKDFYYNGTKWVSQSQGKPSGTTAAYVGTAVYDPASSNPIAVFVAGVNGDLFDKYYDSTTAKWVWQSQGNPGVSIFGSAAVYDPASSNPIIDFVGGTNGQLYDKYYDNGTSDWVWQSQGLPTGTTVAYVGTALYDPTSSNPLIVWVTGANGHLLDLYYDNNTHDWLWQDQGTPPGTTAVGAASAFYQPTSHPVTAFVTGANGHLFVNYYNGTKWVWRDQGTPTGATVVGTPSALYDPTSSNSNVAFVVGSNGHLFSNYYNGKKWVWQDQDAPTGELVSSTAGVSTLYNPGTDPADPLIAFVMGATTGDLYENYWNGSAWEWEKLGK